MLLQHLDRGGVTMKTYVRIDTILSYSIDPFVQTCSRGQTMYLFSFFRRAHDYVQDEDAIRPFGTYFIGRASVDCAYAILLRAYIYVVAFKILCVSQDSVTSARPQCAFPSTAKYLVTSSSHPRSLSSLRAVWVDCQGVGTVGAIRRSLQ